MSRARFQHGWISRQARTSGDLFYFNWREYADGKVVKRAVKLGLVAEIKTESEAYRRAELKRLDINQNNNTCAGLMTVYDLVNHYRKYELQADQDESNKASTTKDSYETYIASYITPKWGLMPLSEVKAVAVEDWMKTLTAKPRREGQAPKSLARSTKAKVRHVMHILWQHGIRHELTNRNPIASVRSSNKRMRTPDVLGVEEFVRFFRELQKRERVAVLLDAGTGLRRSELFALQWGDIDEESSQVSVVRSIVMNTKRDRVGNCKTETSRKPVPLDEFMLAELDEWRRLSEYRGSSDWIFASPHSRGKFPYWPDNILKRHLRPAAVRAGITKLIGWHTFRRTYATLLKANGEDVKVVQQLLRHASIRMTLDVYAQAIPEHTRKAQARVVRMLVPLESKATK